MARKKTILIVDDHPLFREGLKAIIERQDGNYEVFGETGNGREAIRMAEQHKPDLVVMDISLPDINGIDVTREIRSCVPDTPVMIVSMHSKIDYIAEAFQAGATGYLVKESAAAGLLKGLDAISNGEYFLDKSLSRQVVNQLMESPARDKNIRDNPYNTLTPREQEVMRMLAEGLSPKGVAEKLFISPKTVENHRANIMSKLDLHSTVELVRYAAKIGLIDVDLWKG
ncbi:MAG: response regulator transcription factor [Thermodesulfobacteriota bacterium]|nr:response regulator transcription factor [Thermodesulfobacteriota bacterium]